MKVVWEDQTEALARGTADDYLSIAKKKLTNRKVIVVVFAYALRRALDELSPDERSACLEFAMAEVQR